MRGGKRARETTPPPNREPPPPGTPTKKAKVSRNQRTKEKMNKLLAQVKGMGKGTTGTGTAGLQPPHPPGGKQGGKAGGGKGGKGPRIPDEEYKVIMGLKSKSTAGKPICRFFASSVGCPRPGCTFAHECPVCGQEHAWAQFHK
jgi:hypothetical protein